MTNNKHNQINRALKSKKRIWAISIIYKEYLKNDRELMKEGKSLVVYVVDDSMARAVKKAIHYFGRITNIKYIKMKPWYSHDTMNINCRRATKIELVNVRAGYGLKGPTHASQGLEIIF